MEVIRYYIPILLMSFICTAQFVGTPKHYGFPTNVKHIQINDSLNNEVKGHIFNDKGLELCYYRKYKGRTRDSVVNYFENDKVVKTVFFDDRNDSQYNIYTYKNNKIIKQEEYYADTLTVQYLNQYRRGKLSKIIYKYKTSKLHKSLNIVTKTILARKDCYLKAMSSK